MILTSQLLPVSALTASSEAGQLLLLVEIDHGANSTPRTSRQWVIGQAAKQPDASWLFYEGWAVHGKPIRDSIVGWIELETP